jgi:ElaB/YqjD/DUF883 family membrane-anchored ribosome-binding protein
MTDTPTSPNSPGAQDPEAIERDIRRTQEDMSRTVEKIGDQLSIKNVVNALLDKADQNNVDARMLLDGARRNPVALGLIAAGAIWLVSDKDAKFPTLKSKSSSRDDADWSGDNDVHHRDYVSHMSAVEMRDGEDLATYQRRRDLARANFLMVERRDDEDDRSFRDRLDSMTETFREKRRAWADSAGQLRARGGRAGAAAGEKAKAAASRTQELYAENPLVGGILAAAVGAAFGSALPVTRQEQERLGSLGEKARDAIGEQKEQLTDQLREKKDALLDKADERLQAGANPAQHSTSGPQAQGGSEAGGTRGTGSEVAGQEEPFILSDRVR